LVDFYLHTAVAGDRLLNPHRRPVEVPPAVPGCRPLAFGDQAEAMAWFNAEHAGLLATQRYAADQGWHRVVIGLTWALTSFFRRRGYLADAIGACRAALAAAEAVGDPALHANVEQWLGHAYERANALPEALEHFHRALELGEQAGDLHVQDHTHHSLAQVYERRGEYERGLEHAQRALAMSRALGSSAVAEARSLTAVGWFWGLLGNHGEARAACEAALELFRRHHNREGEAAALDSLGFIANQSGRRRQALAHYEEALALLRDLGDAYHEAETLDRIGQTVLALGDRERALAYLRRARDMCLDQGRDEDAARIRRQIDSLAALA
jgi:tetratricopeptide (TPR) repeat protein